MNEEKGFSESEVIDLPSVLERIGGDENFLQELLTIYLEEFREKSAKLHQAIASQDFITIQELGHSLKGSSANLSLLELQKIAFDLEAAGRQADLKRAKESLEALEKAFERLRARLADFTWWTVSI